MPINPKPPTPYHYVLNGAGVKLQLKLDFRKHMRSPCLGPSCAAPQREGLYNVDT